MGLVAPSMFLEQPCPPQQVDAETGRPVKKRKSTKACSGMPGDVLDLVDVETFSLEISLPDGPRQRQITDDWVASIFGPLQGISSQDVKLPDVNKLLTCLVHYCFHGIVSLDGQTYTEYKPLREAVRLMIVRSHLAPLMLARAETLTTMTEGADAAAFIAQQ